MVFLVSIIPKFYFSVDSLNLDGGGSASEISDTHSSSVRRVSLRTSQVPYYQALVSSGTEWSSDELSDADSELESRAEEGSPRVHNSFTSPSFTTDGMDVIEHFETLQDKLKHEEFIHHRQLHYNMKQDLDKAKKLLEQEFLDDNDDED